MSEHTARQHYTPRFRFRYFEDNKLHYEFSKEGKYLGHKGIGRGIATKNDLYEPRDNGYDNYADNAIETDLFANNIEPRHKHLIDCIIQTVQARNVINYRECFESVRVLSLGMGDYNALMSLLNIQLMRQPSTIDNMKDMPLSKLSFFEMVDAYLDDIFCVLSIGYVIDDSEFILPDCGMVCGTDTSSHLSDIIMPITPKICIQRTSGAGGQVRWLKDIRNPVRLRPITERFVKWVNNQSVIQCNEKFISRTRDYII